MDRKTVLIAVIAVLVALVTLVFVSAFGSSGPVTGVANAVARPLKAWASSVARTFEGIYGSIYKYEKLLEDYQDVLKELAALKETAGEAAELEAEVKRLYLLLDLSEKNSGHVYAPALIVTPSSSNWSSSFTINIGSDNSEIVAGNGVVTEYGALIGKVSDVGANQSTVVTILDTTFSAAVNIGDSGNSATAKGDFTLMHRGLLKLDHIEGEYPVLPGDTIVTSGYGGVYPPGLVIGEVVEVFNHPTGIGQYATIRPMLPLDTVLYVNVITAFDVAEQ